MAFCPTCNDEFSSEKGMKRHHAITHGESLIRVEVECDYCGSEFERKEPNVNDGNNFCSRDCMGKWRSENQVGEDHHQYELVTVECDNCGEETEKKPFYLENRDNLFCDQACYGEWRSDNVTGDNHPRYDHIEDECEWCGDTVSRRRGNMEHNEMVFCDLDCYSNWCSENRTGGDNPVFKGGGEFYYGPNWLKQRQARLEKDGFECQDCGLTQEESLEKHDSGLHIHHQKPVRQWYQEADGKPDFEAMNSLDNLITVCRNCHKTREAN